MRGEDWRGAEWGGVRQPAAPPPAAWLLQRGCRELVLEEGVLLREGVQVGRASGMDGLGGVDQDLQVKVTSPDANAPHIGLRWLDSLHGSP